MIKKYGYFFIAALLAIYEQGSLQAAANIYHNTPLHLACEHQDEGAVEMYIDLRKEYIYAKNISQSLPIHRACFVGNIKIVKLLIQAGSPLNNVDGSGRTPLAIARERYEQYMLYQTVICKTENGRDEIRVPSEYNRTMAKKFESIIVLLTKAIDLELAQLSQELGLD